MHSDDERLGRVVVIAVVSLVLALAAVLLVRAHAPSDQLRALQKDPMVHGSV